MLVVTKLQREGHVDDAQGFVLLSIINGIIDSLTGTHLMTKGSIIAEIADYRKTSMSKPEYMLTYTSKSRRF